MVLCKLTPPGGGRVETADAFERIHVAELMLIVIWRFPFDDPLDVSSEVCTWPHEKNYSDCLDKNIWLDLG